MMVGHTHDDVDQMFGCFSRGFKWKHEPLFTLDDMLQSIRDHFSPTPAVFKLRQLQDWKAYLDEISNHRRRKMKLHGHLRPLQFWVTIHPTHPDGRAYCRFKRFSTDEEWKPLLESTPDIILLADRLSIDNLNPLPLKDVPVELFTDVIATYKVCKALRIGGREDLWESSIPDMLLAWSGYRMEGGIPRFVGHPQLENVVPIPVERRWGHVAHVDGKVVVRRNIPDHSYVAPNDDGRILEGDVDTDDELLVYQGDLHSKTNKKMFIDISTIDTGQFLLVRRVSSSDNPVELCKVLGQESDTVLKVHWYGGNSIVGAQHPLQKKRLPGKKQGPKNVPYHDTVDVDSILTNEKFQLNRNKTIPKKIYNLALRRLEKVQTIQANN